MGYIRLITHLLIVYQLPGGHPSSKAFFFRKDLFVDDSIPELESSSCCLAVAPVLQFRNSNGVSGMKKSTGRFFVPLLNADSHKKIPKKAIRFSNMKHLCIAAFCSVFLQSQELPCKKLNTSPTKTGKIRNNLSKVPGLKP